MQRGRQIDVKFSLPEALKQKVEARAKELSISRNAVMRIAIIEYFKKEEC